MIPLGRKKCQQDETLRFHLFRAIDIKERKLEGRVQPPCTLNAMLAPWLAAHSRGASFRVVRRTGMMIIKKNCLFFLFRKKYAT